MNKNSCLVKLPNSYKREKAFKIPPIRNRSVGSKQNAVAAYQVR